LFLAPRDTITVQIYLIQHERTLPEMTASFRILSRWLFLCLLYHDLVECFHSTPTMVPRRQKAVSRIRCMASSLDEGDTIAVVNANARVAELISEKIIAQGRFRVRLIGNNAQVSHPRPCLRRLLSCTPV
jgi:hypothetical protein